MLIRKCSGKLKQGTSPGWPIPIWCPREENTSDDSGACPADNPQMHNTMRMCRGVDQKDQPSPSSLVRVRCKKHSAGLRRGRGGLARYRLSEAGWTPGLQVHGGTGHRRRMLAPAAGDWRRLVVCCAFAGLIQVRPSHTFATEPPFKLAHPLTQVVSDIDDTLKSSGGIEVAGIALGGIDVQYSRGTLYPGVAQFFYELSCYPVTKNKRHHEEHRRTDDSAFFLSPPKVAVLTARAEEFKAALEIKDTSKLALKLTNVDPTSNWGIGPVLYGSVSEWVIQNKKGLRKFNNFERLLRQDPTGNIMRYVFCGDVGELDEEAGETILREYPEVVLAVFLHVVSAEPPSNYPPDGLDIPPSRLINGRPLVHFRTYVGAANLALKFGLLEPDALIRVIREAESDLKSLNESETSSKWVDLRRDIDDALVTLSGFS